jgi:hypothetical protein
MDQCLGINWYGSSDKTVQDAARLLAEILAASGKYVQAYFPVDLPVCRFPAIASNRVSDTPIKSHSPSTPARVAVVLDARVLKYADSREDIRKQPLLVINTALDPALIKEKLNLAVNQVLCLDIGDCTPPYIPFFILLVDRLGIFPPEVFKKRLEVFLSTQVKAEPLAEQLKSIDRVLQEVREA